MEKIIVNKTKRKEQLDRYVDKILKLAKQTANVGNVRFTFKLDSDIGLDLRYIQKQVQLLTGGTVFPIPVDPEYLVFGIQVEDEDEDEEVSDDVKDLALHITDKLIEMGYVPDCTDTDKEEEFEVQDAIRDILKYSDIVLNSNK